MKRSRYRKKKYYGKGLIRPTLNKGRIFVGQGLLKKPYKKREKSLQKRYFYKRDIARTGAKYLPELYQGGVNKIKNKNLKKVLQSDLASGLVNNLSSKI